MAPLAPSNTERFKIFYTVGGRQHVQEVRTDSVSPATLGTTLDAYYDALSTSIYTTVIDQVQYAPQGSDIFNAVTTGIEGNSYGSGSPSVAGETPYFFSFIGRSSGGRRMRFYQFGAKALGSDYRFAAGESAVLDAARAVIVGSGSAWLAIDDLKPVMQSYINAGVNAYWQRKVRP